MRLLAWLLPLALLAGCGHGTKGPPLGTVPAVDLQRYSGTWHEIARYPNRFEDGRGLDCAEVTATYAPLPDGRISVVNRCRNAADGDKVQEARGTAYAVAGSSNARLRVSFFWPFYGDYWVIGLDPGYRWAVVGEPRRDYLWVLARAPRLSEAEWQDVLGAIRAGGYDPARLKRGRQAAASAGG